MVPPHHSGTDPVMTLCSSIPLHADHLTSIVHRSSDYAPLLDHPPNRGSQPSGPQRNGPFSTAHLQAHSNTCHLCHFCARHTHKFHSCCFVDYVFQRKSPRRWAWRCRRKQLTHVQRISLAGVVSRATCIGAGRAANRAALCVCIDWGCICKGRVVWPRSGKRDLFRTARLSIKGCVAVPRGHVGSCKEELTCTIVSNWRFWAGLFLKWVC
jgi:hypothetical protein